MSLLHAGLPFLLGCAAEGSLHALPLSSISVVNSHPAIQYYFDTSQLAKLDACRECISAELAMRDRCPLCRKQITLAELTEGVSAAREGNEENDGGNANAAAANIMVSESKLRVLLAEVRMAGTVCMCCLCVIRRLHQQLLCLKSVAVLRFIEVYIVRLACAKIPEDILRWWSACAVVLNAAGKDARG